MTKIEKLESKIKEEIEKLIFNILKDFDLSNYKIEIKVFETGCLIDIKLKYFFNLYINYTNIYTSTYLNKLNMDIVNNVEFQLPYVTGYIINDYITKSCSLKEYVEFLDSEDIKVIKVLYSNKDILEKELKNILE